MTTYQPTGCTRIVNPANLASCILKNSGFWLIVATLILELNAVPRVKAESTLDLKGLRREWIFKQRAYPLGYIPEAARERAFKEMEAGRKPRAMATGSGGAQWIRIGPAPILENELVPPAPVSGRVTSIAVDPANSMHWMIGSGMGGAWETSDGGSTWRPLTDDQPALAVGAVAFAASDPSLRFVGTGEPNGSDSYSGVGLLKSRDGGQTWQLLGIDVFGKASISSILVDPKNANRLAVATAPDNSVQLGERATSPLPPLPAKGIYISADGGATWTKRFGGPVLALTANPSNFNQQYAGMADNTGKTPGAVVRSLDGGSTWNQLNGPWSTSPVVRIAISISPSNNNRAYVCVAATDSTLAGIWRTDNAWATTPTWVPLPLPTSPLDQMGYDLTISVDPSDPDIMYFGAVAVLKFDGSAWSVIGGDYNTGLVIHPDNHALAWAGTQLLVGNDGGVWGTPDGGTTFSSYNAGLALTQFNWGSVHPLKRDLAIAGAQDNGTSAWYGNPLWKAIDGGDGSDNAISPSHPDSKWITSAQKMALTRQTVNPGGDLKSESVFSPDTTAYGVPFSARLAISPVDENTVLLGATKLLRANNFFSANPPSFAIDSPELNAEISALAFAPSDRTGRTFAFATSDAQIWVTTTGSGNDALNLNAGGGVPGRYVTALSFHPGNANILYAALSGFDEGTPGKPGHLYKTANALSGNPTWSRVGPTVNLPLNALAIDPANPNNIYVGGDIGVWKTADAGATWSRMGPESGLPNVAVYDLKIQAGTGRLFAFTHGRGAWVLDPRSASAPPTISGFSPTQGPVGTTVVLSGNKLDGATAVRFNGLPASSFTVVSPTKVSAVVPLGATAGLVSVTTPGGIATSTTSYSVTSVPSVVGFSPAFGGPGSVVTITGANLGGATGVAFGNTAATLFKVVSASQITVTVPAGATTGKITVRHPAGNAQSANAFVVTAGPILTGFAPSAGGIGTRITVSGANFSGVSSVFLQGTPATFTVNSASELVLTVPANAATGNIRIVTTAGTVDSKTPFTVIPRPGISGFTPQTGVAFSQVTITGSGFTGTTSVKFAGVSSPAFRVVSAAQLVATVPSGFTNGVITVTTTGGLATSKASFTLLSGPTNDYLVDAQPIAGISGSVSGNNSGASLEVGEPNITGNPGGESVWFTWTAPKAGRWTFYTQGTLFDTLLAVYTGDAVDQLTLVGGNDNIPGTNTSSVSFTASAGTTYQISVDGATPSLGEAQFGPTPSGPLVLNWNLSASLLPRIVSVSPATARIGQQVTLYGVNFLGCNVLRVGGVAASFQVISDFQILATIPVGARSGQLELAKPGPGKGAGQGGDTISILPSPANDNFASATIITGSAGSLIDNNLGATVETGEPEHAGVLGGSSLWYRWTAPGSGAWTFNSFGSGFDTLLAVYTGTNVDSLVNIASNDDAGNGSTSLVQFAAVAGTPYLIAVDGFHGFAGTVALNWAFTAHSPVITQVSPPSGIAGTTVTLTGTNFSSAVALTFNGLEAPFVVNSTTQLVATVPPGASTGPISLVTIDSSAQTSDNFLVGLNRPDNDLFANRLAIVGASLSVTGSNIGATKETGEPQPADNPGGSSVWWTWTAPSSGTYTVTTRASDFDTVLAIYTGTNVNTLHEIASNDEGLNLEPQSLANLSAIAGTQYQILVDGYNGAAGNIILSVYPGILPRILYTTGFEPAEGFTTNSLPGQAGWLGDGLGQNGLEFDAFSDGGFQAYLNVGGVTTVYHPVNAAPDTNSLPVVVFSVDQAVLDSTDDVYDQFGWNFVNRDGQNLFSLVFDNESLGIFYSLNNGDLQDSGHSFENDLISHLEVSLDFAHNLWNATLDGEVILQQLPIASTNTLKLDLGRVETQSIAGGDTVGDNYLLFDNYTVAASGDQTPRIITPPHDLTVPAGTNPTLFVVADSHLPLSYQWSLGTTPIPGATNATLDFSHITTDRSGDYRVQVSNVAGTVASLSAKLVVKPVATPALLLAGLTQLSEHGFQVGFSGTPQVDYTVQYSVDLVHWTDAITITANDAPSTWTDTSSTGFTQRFYRVIAR